MHTRSRQVPRALYQVAKGRGPSHPPTWGNSVRHRLHLHLHLHLAHPSLLRSTNGPSPQEQRSRPHRLGEIEAFEAGGPSTLTLPRKRMPWPACALSPASPPFSSTLLTAPFPREGGRKKERRRRRRKKPGQRQQQASSHTRQAASGKRHRPAASGPTSPLPCGLRLRAADEPGNAPAAAAVVAWPIRQNTQTR